MRDRARSLVRAGQTPDRVRSDGEVALEEIVRLAQQHGELYPIMVEILNHYGQILQKDIGLSVKLHHPPL